MFDTVGREIDPELRRRQAVLVGWTTVLAAVAAGAGVLLAASVVPVTPAALPEVPDVMVELALDAAPTAPAAPAAPRIARGEPSSTAAPTPPDPADPPALTPAPSMEERASEPPAGSPDGDPHGDPAGDPNGRPDGRLGGRGDGGTEDGGGVRPIAQSQLEWKRQPSPDYPRAALGLGLGAQRCVVKLRLDADGVPVDVRPVDCLPAFGSAAVEALSDWRAYPVRLGGARIPVQTTVVIHFQER
jgi:outer membrane biosynthesis protein TonB